MVKGVSAPFFEAADLKQARVGEQTYLGIKKELSKAQTVRTLSNSGMLRITKHHFGGLVKPRTPIGRLRGTGGTGGSKGGHGSQEHHVTRTGKSEKGMERIINIFFKIDPEEHVKERGFVNAAHTTLSGS